MKRRLLDILTIMVGSFIFALAINVLIIPTNLGEGGVTGIALIFYYLFEWSPGLVTLVVNSLLVVIGYKFLSKTSVLYTIIAVIFNSLFLHLTHDWRVEASDMLVNAIFGGVLAGLGIGMVIRTGGTTAGTTILARIANKYFGWSISYGLLFFDLIVVFSSYFLIGMERLMVTIVMLYVGTKVMDFIVEGMNHKKAVTIISKSHEEIAERINQKTHRGITVLTGYGYYTKDDKKILYVIIHKQEVLMLKKIVKAIDDESFVAIHDVRDVIGKGFMDNVNA